MQNYLLLLRKSKVQNFSWLNFPDFELDQSLILIVILCQIDFIRFTSSLYLDNILRQRWCKLFQLFWKTWLLDVPFSSTHGWYFTPQTSWVAAVADFICVASECTCDAAPRLQSKLPLTPPPTAFLFLTFFHHKNLSAPPSCSLSAKSDRAGKVNKLLWSYPAH